MRYKEAKGSTNVRTTFQDCDILTGQSSYSMVAIKLKGGSVEEMPVIISSWWWCVLLLLISNSWPSSRGKTQQLPFPLLWHLFEWVWPIKQPHLTLSTLQPEETHNRGNKHWGFLNGTPATSSPWWEVKRSAFSYVYDAKAVSTRGGGWRRDALLSIQPNPVCCKGIGWGTMTATCVCSESQSSISHSPVNEKWWLLTFSETWSLTQQTYWRVVLSFCVLSAWIFFLFAFFYICSTKNIFWS